MDQFLSGLTGWHAIFAMGIVGAFAGIRMWLGVKGELRKDEEQSTVGDGYQELIDGLRVEVERLKQDILTLIEENKQLRTQNISQQAEINSLKFQLQRLT